MDGSILLCPEAIPEADDDTGMWNALADELVDIIVSRFLLPGCAEDPWRSRPLGELSGFFAQESIGMAHWVQLGKALSRRGEAQAVLRRNRRRHRETTACCRVLQCQEANDEDWPLMVLNLRAGPSPNKGARNRQLSHVTPIARQTLRSAYWAVAREVHPDRTETPLATQAMIVLNEAYRQAVLHFAERTSSSHDVIRLDALGQQHDATFLL